ncbi:MAG: class I lanthipeptide [Thermoanaerobaculia bacterium]
MKRKKNDRKKLSLSKETLAPLEAQSLGGVAAGACPLESNRICSIQHTCVSCVATQDTCA